MDAEIIAPETRSLDALSDQLARWLQARMPSASDVAIDSLTYPKGAGRSHETILFEASWTHKGARERHGLVVRIKPGGFAVFPDDLFVEQYEIMRLMHARGAVRVAEPLWLERDPALLGAPFFVMRRVEGRVPISIPRYAEAGWLYEASLEDRRRAWENGVRQLAAIQSVPPAAAPFLRGQGAAAAGLAQEWDKYVRFIDWVSEDRPFPALTACLARLESRWPSNQPPGIVWGDARLGNMMFDDAFDVVAVMDWEQPSLGGALQDLAWWLYMSEKFHGATDTRPYMPGLGTREETIDLWGSLTGIPTVDIDWYEDFTNLKLIVTAVRMAKLKGWDYTPDDLMAARLGVTLP